MPRGREGGGEERGGEGRREGGGSPSPEREREGEQRSHAQPARAPPAVSLGSPYASHELLAALTTEHAMGGLKQGHPRPHAGQVLPPLQTLSPPLSQQHSLPQRPGPPSGWSRPLTLSSGACYRLCWMQATAGLKKQVDVHVRRTVQQLEQTLVTSEKEMRKLANFIIQKFQERF
eukprot:1142454-Pelagomonas_calceolata.AAC.1